MIVIAKKNTTELVKGARYEVAALFNSPTVRRPRVIIKGLGGYNIDAFTDTSGNELPKVDVLAHKEEIKRLEFIELKMGDILVCSTNQYKTLVKDAKYKIEDLRVDKVEYTTWNGQKQFREINKIKLMGVRRWLEFSNWKFRGLFTEESREISLNSVLLGQEPEIIKTDKLRKIDHVKNKNEELIMYLARAIYDPNRNNLSVIDWACKIGNKMAIQPSDYEHLMNLSLVEILQQFDKK